MAKAFTRRAIGASSLVKDRQAASQLLKGLCAVHLQAVLLYCSTPCAVWCQLPCQLVLVPAACPAGFWMEYLQEGKGWGEW